MSIYLCTIYFYISGPQGKTINFRTSYLKAKKLMQSFKKCLLTWSWVDPTVPEIENITVLALLILYIFTYIRNLNISHSLVSWSNNLGIYSNNTDFGCFLEQQDWLKMMKETTQNFTAKCVLAENGFVWWVCPGKNINHCCLHEEPISQYLCILVGVFLLLHV